ncbi:hypothetical protein WDZ92_11560 [Nostoc sp. NIES-2111]
MTEVEPPIDDHWIPLSDLMSGLMMLFMMLTIAFMAKDSDTAQRRMSPKPAEVSASSSVHNTTSDSLRTALLAALRQELGPDLARWHAELEQDLTIRFDSADYLFATGRADLTPRFAAQLSEFFPRYIRVLASSQFRGSIAEIKIEGHTSTKWQGSQDLVDAYLRNMDLSQGRTREALRLLIHLDLLAENRPWLMRRIAASGLSSSRPK